jgi:hypothetical protein
MNACWARLLAFLCITIQVVLGSGVFAAAPDLEGSGSCCVDCALCEEVQVEDRCCGPAAPPTRSCTCPLAGPRTAAVPVERVGQLRQVATPAPEPVEAWWPVGRGAEPLAVRPLVACGLVRDSCGLLTTRLLI